MALVYTRQLNRFCCFDARPDGPGLDPDGAAAFMPAA